jgi:hypothetical protein
VSPRVRDAVPADLKEILFRIFEPGNKASRLLKLRAKPGAFYNEEAVDAALLLAAEKVEAVYPSHEYTVVQIGPAHFNFVWVGARGGTS